jgi:hypothetical protein
MSSQTRDLWLDAGLILAGLVIGVVAVHFNSAPLGFVAGGLFGGGFMMLHADLRRA